MKRFFKRKSRLFAAILLIFAALLSLCACAHADKTVPCVDIVKAVTNIEIGLPAGKIYSSTADEGEEGYIPDSLLSSLFGEGKHISLFDGWIDCAFFMPSSAHPCEIVAILCDTPVTADDTARLLYRRLNTVKTVKSEEKYANYIDNAEVNVCHNYVLLIISADTNAAKKAALSVIN